jgi:rhomboid family GlyGly-CTERM serine protease
MQFASALRTCDPATLPWRTLLLTLAALALYFGAGPAPAGLVLDRAAVASGEWWRPITGHWVHSDASHALWNIAAFAFLGALFEGRLGWRMIAALGLGMLSVNLWFLVGLPDLTRYCGLSGILNALLAAGLVAMWRDTRDPLVVLVGIGAVLKIVVESVLDHAVFSTTAWASVPTAHAAGYIAGLLATWSPAGGTPRRRSGCRAWRWFRFLWLPQTTR